MSVLETRSILASQRNYSQSLIVVVAFLGIRGGYGSCASPLAALSF